MDRVLRLTCNLAWLGLSKEAFDHDKGCWRVPPRSFIPPGHQAQSLLFVGDGETATLRQFVYLEADSKGANYFANKANRAPLPINLSLDQFNLAVGEQIKASLSDAPVGDDVPTTPGEARARRRPRQTVATQAPNTDANGNLAPTGKSDRAFYVATLNANLTASGKVLAVETLGIVTRADLTDAAWNALVDLALVFDRIQEVDMQNADNGKASKPKAA
jgi:hypothetical protein